MSIRTFAAIDVGSFELSMKIFQFSGKNNMREIDHVKQRIDLGSDTYATGKLSPEKVDELCRTLKEFSDIMSSYKVEAYRAYGTSAIRESENSMILLDQIAQRTGIRVEVLSNSEQRFLDYKAIASRGENFRKIIEERTAIVDIGGGSIQVSLFEKDALISTQNLRLGVLRIQEMLHHMNSKSNKIEELADEIATAQLSTYKQLYLKEHTIQNIIVVDDYLSPWELKNVSGIEKQAVTSIKEFEAFSRILRSKGTTEVAQMMDITEERVPLVKISAVLVGRIAKLMGAECIWAPGATLCDGIAYEYAEKIKILRGEHDFEKDIIACARNISKRYMGNKKRTETLEQIAETIFNSMKKIHGLGKREKLYLRIAAILCDCGKYVSLMNIGDTSYNIIMATEIIGLSHTEREIIANIVKFNHTDFKYYEQWVMKGIDRSSYLVVAKLTAILRLADNLDCSDKQKVKDVVAKLQENELILQVETQEDITLEASFFGKRAAFFTEVFSITPVLKQKKNF